MNYREIQSQYDKIHAYFKTTTEPFDSIELDEETIQVWLKDDLMERYSMPDMRTIIYKNKN